MSKHHIEDIPDDVRLRVNGIARTGVGQHRKTDFDERYPAFASNHRALVQRYQNAFEIGQYASAAAAVMHLSGAKWKLDWTV